MAALTPHGAAQFRATPVDVVTRALAGDDTAFTTLFQQYGPLVESVVRSIVRNREDASDVSQEVWIRAADRLPALRDQNRFPGWLARIARNVSLNFIRAERSVSRTSSADDGRTFADHSGGSPEQLVLTLDERRKVWEALAMLSEHDRTALYLRDLRGLDYRAVAAELGVKTNAAEVRVFRARARFREQFDVVDEGAVSPLCGTTPLQLTALVDGELDAATQVSLLAHVDACPGCAERLRSMRVGQRLARVLGFMALPGTMPGGAVPASWIASAIAALHAKIAAVLGGTSAAATGSVTGTAAVAGTATAATTATAAATSITAITAASTATATGGGILAAAATVAGTTITATAATAVAATAAAAIGVSSLIAPISTAPAPVAAASVHEPAVIPVIPASGSGSLVLSTSAAPALAINAAGAPASGLPTAGLGDATIVVARPAAARYERPDGGDSMVASPELHAARNASAHGASDDHTARATGSSESERRSADKVDTSVDKSGTSEQRGTDKTDRGLSDRTSDQRTSDKTDKADRGQPNRGGDPRSAENGRANGPIEHARAADSVRPAGNPGGRGAGSGARR